MRKQTLKFKAGQPICIATLTGLIKIHRGRNNRELIFEMPDGLKAFKGEERAVQNTPKVFNLGQADSTSEEASEPVTQKEND